MAERIVIDTGPIIALARADALGFIAKLPIEFVAPIEVRDELDEGVRHGHPAVAVAWLEFASLAAPISPLVLADLAEAKPPSFNLRSNNKSRSSGSTNEGAGEQPAPWALR